MLQKVNMLNTKFCNFAQMFPDLHSQSFYHQRSTVHVT